MPALMKTLTDNPGIAVLLFVLGDIFMIPTHGPNLLSWLFLAAAAACGGVYYFANGPRLRR